MANISQKSVVRRCNLVLNISTYTWTHTHTHTFQSNSSRICELFRTRNEMRQLITSRLAQVENKSLLLLWQCCRSSPVIGLVALHIVSFFQFFNTFLWLNGPQAIYYGESQQLIKVWMATDNVQTGLWQVELVFTQFAAQLKCYFCPKCVFPCVLYFHMCSPLYLLFLIITQMLSCPPGVAGWKF